MPINIINKCNIINVKRPSKTKYQKCLKNKIDKSLDINSVTNIKNLKSSITKLNKIEDKICNKIIDKITNYNTINFIEFREILYEILIYNLDVNKSILYIISHFINNKSLNDDNLEKIYLKLSQFLIYYNNNYRPIYHLESFFYYLCKVIHGL